MPNAAYNRHATRRIYEDDEGPYCVIPLTRGKKALISPEDFDLIAPHRWCADKSMAGVWYAHRGVYLGGGRKHCKIRKVKMHHAILGCKPIYPMVVDHINSNGLDNRRENLHVVEHSANIQRGRHRTNRHGYMGIRHHEDCASRPWFARISDNGKRIGLGFHVSAEAAARAYDAAARQLHGEHAKVNFPNET